MSEKVIVGITARMGSTRVPGKCMLPVGDRYIIDYVIELCKEIHPVSEVVLATGLREEDDPLVERADRAGIPCFRGHPEYLLDRYYHLMLHHDADTLVGVGGDCPLADPEQISQALKHFMSQCERPDRTDYLSNYDPPTFPEGLDINIIRRSALKKAFEDAMAPSQRIHAFSYLTRHPDIFRIENYENEEDLSTLHWSLDFPEDLHFIRAVIDRLPDLSDRKMKNILKLISGDEIVRKAHMKTTKPNSLHAFWNSPGIVKDMSEDVFYLAKSARDIVTGGDSGKARIFYEEIISISKELSRIGLHRE